jgi:hypothetical protein
LKLTSTIKVQLYLLICLYDLICIYKYNQNHI